MNNKNFIENKRKEMQNEYSKEIDRKTMEFQRKFGFELNPNPEHRTWNVEADAFKHAFMSADLALKNGNTFSMGVGIYHEGQTPNNPPGEWNMDSWNNAQGRIIADEIRKEYGNKFNKFSDKEKDAIVATKVIMKMRKVN